VNALVRLREVHRSFRMGGATVNAVDGVTMDVAAGDFLAIVGPSGCGKSTLLNLMGVVDRPSSGSVEISGLLTSTLSESAATSVRLRSVGLVFQRFYLVPMLTAQENIELPMAEAGVPRAGRRARSAELLEYVGLSSRARHLPSELSGGEQQRVAIARAIANEPPLLLADEPTGELDATTGLQIIELLRGLNDGGTTVVVVTHDSVLATAARRIVRMRDGRIISEETAR
jgi:putative ABC transport system ATP-binding protein